MIRQVGSVCSDVIPSIVSCRGISTIPYHPSLALGQIVDPNVLAYVKGVAEDRVPMDVLQDSLNDLLFTRRSLDQTFNELINMGIEVTGEMTDAKEKVNAGISDNALKLANARMEFRMKQLGKPPIAEVTDTIESPVNFNKSTIMTSPLSVDSLKLDVQFFKKEAGKQGASNHTHAIKTWATNQVDGAMNAKGQQNIVNTVGAQVSEQTDRNEIAGTLLIGASCTHKNANVYAPLVFDVEKAIRAWNKTFPDDLFDPDKVSQYADQQGEDTEKTLDILTGTTHGSSFIGQVHFLQTDSTISAQKLESVAVVAQTAFKLENFAQGQSGSFGIDASAASDIKSLFSRHDITSNVSLAVMGVIPTITSSNVKYTVTKFDEFNGNAMMERLNIYRGAAETSAQGTVESAVTQSQTGSTIATFEASKTESALLATASIDNENNKVLDLNSLMTTFENYVEECKSAEGVGVPLNYYVHPMTKYEIARLFIDKYYPGRFLGKVAYGDAELDKTGFE